MRVLVVDNYDSFVFNLVQYLGQLGVAAEVWRNDDDRLADPEAVAGQYDGVLLSPGPGTPDDGGVSNEVIRRFGPTTPVLGVCLGHQCIGQVYGGVVSRAPRLMHGKTSSVYHNGHGLFNGVPSPFTATRYHSLIVEEALPEALAVTAFTRDGEVMGLQHREFPVVGVQFHPESILTEHGKRILQNFLSMTV